MTVDLKAMCAANSANAQLQSIAFLLSEKGKAIAQISLDDPAKAEAELDALRAQVHRCMIDIACEMQTEKDRRAEASPIKIHTPNDTPVIVTDDDEEPTHDIGNPVGAGVRGNPVAQSELTGA